MTRILAALLAVVASAAAALPYVTEFVQDIESPWGMSKIGVEYQFDLFTLDSQNKVRLIPGQRLYLPGGPTFLQREMLFKFPDRTSVMRPYGARVKITATGTGWHTSQSMLVDVGFRSPPPAPPGIEVQSGQHLECVYKMAIWSIGSLHCKARG